MRIEDQLLFCEYDKQQADPITSIVLWELSRLNLWTNLIFEYLETCPL